MDFWKEKSYIQTAFTKYLVSDFFITVQLKSQSMIWSMARETELGLRDREKMQSTEFAN